MPRKPKQPPMKPRKEPWTSSVGCGKEKHEAVLW